MNRRQFQEAIDAGLSGLTTTPAREQEIFLAVKGERVVKKKISAALVLVIILLVMAISFAIAASVGIFDQFAKLEGDPYLNTMEQIAAPYADQPVAIAAYGNYTASAFRLNQAYYDGQSLVISYTLSEQWIPVHFMDPAEAWADGNDIVSEAYQEESKPYYDYVFSPEDIARMEQRLVTEGKVYLKGWSQSVDDIHVAANGVEISASRLNLSHMPDGTTIGYIEFDFPLPEEIREQEVLDLEFRLNRGGVEIYQDESGVFHKDIPYNGPAVTMPVTIQKNAEHQGALCGFEAFEEYTVSAFLYVSDIHTSSLLKTAIVDNL